MNIGYEISFCIDFGAKTSFKPCHFPNSMWQSSFLFSSHVWPNRAVFVPIVGYFYG
jgi:hypothetical protein